MRRPGLIVGLALGLAEQIHVSLYQAADEGEALEERRQALWRFATALAGLQVHVARLPEALGIDPFAWPELAPDPDPTPPADGEGNAP